MSAGGTRCLKKCAGQRAAIIVKQPEIRADIEIVRR
jgi:hypothetical protein